MWEIIRLLTIKHTYILRTMFEFLGICYFRYFKDKKIRNLSAVIGQFISSHAVDITLKSIPGHAEVEESNKHKC